MDPNATLEQLRSLVCRTQNNDDPWGLADEMAELFEGLDTWLAKGGFLPDAWRRGKIP